MLKWLRRWLWDWRISLKCLVLGAIEARVGALVNGLVAEYATKARLSLQERLDSAVRAVNFEPCVKEAANRTVEGALRRIDFCGRDFPATVLDSMASALLDASREIQRKSPLGGQCGGGAPPI